jgi:glycosyltransferase involved in cell wall biosynthesis
MAARIQSQHQRYVIGEKDFETELPDILRAMDQPSTDGINTYFISKYARKAGLKAVLSGIGADELFGGYPTFQRHQWVKRLQWLGPVLGLANEVGNDRIKRLSFLRHQSDEARFLFHRGYFTTEQISELTGFDRPHIRQVLGLQPHSRPTRETAQAYISRLETDFYLKNQLLRDTDYMSMWHSVEVRMPFLDREVMSLVRQLPESVRFTAGRPKGFLIDTFKQYMPEAVWNRRKMGFIFPFGKWMRSVELRGACHPEYFHLRSQYAKGNIQWSRYWAFCLSAGQPLQVKPPDLRIAFCTLRSFSHMGGIEKFNRSFGLALQQNALKFNWQVSHLSAYDSTADPRYFAPAAFVGFGKKRLKFIWYFLNRQRYFDVHIAGHINLAVMILLSGWLAPRSRRLLVAHGVEMWQQLPFFRQMALKQVDEIWSVSQYTARRMAGWSGHKQLPPIRIFPNTLDPFFATANQASLQEASPGSHRSLLTISRLASTEQYKGYDQVIAILPRLVQRFPHLRYVLGGTGDAPELQRIYGQVAALQLEDNVMMPGFVPEDDLPRYYDSATVFVMPSRKEGFGIVFLEAAWMGMRIIGGNADGSPEALLNGQLGVLIDPADPDALYEAIVQQLEEPPLTAAQKEERRQEVQQAFGFEKFKQRQATYLLENKPPRQ